MNYSCEWGTGDKVSKCHALREKDDRHTLCGLSFFGKVWYAIYKLGNVSCAKCARKMKP